MAIASSDHAIAVNTTYAEAAREAKRSEATTARFHSFKFQSPRCVALRSAAVRRSGDGHGYAGVGLPATCLNRLSLAAPVAEWVLPGGEIPRNKKVEPNQPIPDLA